MTWLAWHQFRANALLATLATVAVLVVLIVTRGHVANVTDPDTLATGYKSLRLFGTALIGVPAVIGAFWGAPLLAHEFEAGTFRPAWTQSVTRRRWLATKLGVVSIAAIAIAGGLSLVFSWWSLPFDQLGNRIGTANFGQRRLDSLEQDRGRGRPRPHQLPDRPDRPTIMQRHESDEHRRPRPVRRPARMA